MNNFSGGWISSKGEWHLLKARELTDLSSFDTADNFVKGSRPRCYGDPSKGAIPTDINV